jgi:hypothetical protein
MGTSPSSSAEELALLGIAHSRSESHVMMIEEDIWSL